MTFDLTDIVNAIPADERSRLNALVALCPAPHLTAALTASVSGAPASYDLRKWTDAEIGTALAALRLLEPASTGGRCFRFFHRAMLLVSQVAAERLSPRG